jgi:acetyltransferase-like isoleucine patch superfamily enzyme
MKFPRWSNYYLRYWMVNQSLRLSGRGIFSVHPVLETLYARMLGAKIGRNVHIDKKAKLGEYDLLTIGDDVRIDSALVRGFCVDRDGYFRLDKVTIGRGATINTYTEIAPGAVIPEGTVFGPHASSHEGPSPAGYVHFNKTLNKDPHFLLKLFVAWPIMILVYLASRKCPGFNAELR